MTDLLTIFLCFTPLIYIAYHYIKQGIENGKMNRILHSINVRMSQVSWTRLSKKNSKPLLIKVHHAKILKVFHNSGLDLNATITVENQTSFLFEPHENISFYIDAENDEDFIIEIKEKAKNGYHAKFVLKNQNSYNYNMTISLRPEAAEVDFYNFYKEEFNDHTQIIPAKIYNKEYDIIKYNWVFAHITKLYNFVLKYESILVPKYEQHVYTDEWGELIIEESFWQTVDKLLNKLYSEYSPYELQESKQLTQIAISPYFPKNDELYKVIFSPKKTYPNDIDFINAIKKQNKSSIDIQYFERGTHPVGLEQIDKTITYYSDSGIILGCVSALAQNNKTKNTSTKISPLNYEKHIAILLKNLGFNARTTKASGDQGADILANKNGTKFAIQCKLYSNPVGNKAVQEANTARDYYKCDYAVVVTNSSYTQSARKAANACGVILLHEKQLAKLLNYI